MDGSWLGLIELLLVAGLVLGWAVYELWSVRKPRDAPKPPSPPESGSERAPRHPEG
jgi:hypothetical protein